ncbi:hypothetical protein NliqN6_5512 [Naganishia liquefaciens]|uniref:Mitochondrial import inner membrane translocase subunit tim23 n=1 Tax=Naganishia liquefaciens TaxID=104408 RepID=A0A8H3YGQ2_9TREE|nr:hypothetical protein NliqN6_5512 [Naganishia liquefaciens]
MAFTSFLSDKQNYTGNAQSAPQPATSSQLFQDASFSSSSSIPTGAEAASSTPTPSLPSSSDLFAASAYDPAKLHPLASLGDNLDYLALEDAKVADLPGASSALPSRGWSDELCYGTGSTYLSGLVLGGAWGLKEGMQRPLGSSSSMKLRINSILNACTRRGSFLGNNLGILALFYNGVNSSIDAYRGKHDTYGAIAAGALSGVIYKATAGVKPAIAGGVLMAGASTVWSFAKQTILDIDL